MNDFERLLSKFESWALPSSMIPPPYPLISDGADLKKVDQGLLIEKLKGEFQKSHHSFVGVDDTLGILDFLRNPDTLAMLKTTGKKHVLLEYPYYQQPNIDQLWENKISPKEFVREYQRLNWEHEDISDGVHSKKIRLQASAMANLIVKAKTAGIRIGFVDADLDTRDVKTPHSNCAIQDGPWREEFAEKWSKLKQDYEKSLGRPAEFSDWSGIIKYMDAHPKEYPGIRDLINKNQEWWKVRVNENNKFIAQLVQQRTQGEDYVMFFGAAHLEGKDSVPAYLATNHQSSHVTRLGRNKDKSETEYAFLTSPEWRIFTNRDFTNPPDSVLLLSGPSGKPEFYSPPASWIAEAKELTRKGGYDSSSPAHPELTPLAVTPSIRRFEYQQADADSFAQSLVCAPATPASAPSRKKL